PNANFNGSAGISIATDDQGNFGSGGALSDSDNVPITVNAVNDPPVNTVPGAQSVNEDTGLVFSTANGNLISVTDVDALLVQITLSVTNGTLTLNGTTGLNFSTGDGTADGTLVFTGTVSDVNTALDGMIFTPTQDYNGPATLSLTTDDQGSSG